MKADDLRSLERTERMMVRWMCGVSLKDRKCSDSKLTFIPHLKYLRKKCLQAINLLRVVGHYDNTTLLKLYDSTIRSKLDYGCMVYGSACDSYLKMLDRIQNKALRICLGAFRTSPIPSLQVYSNLLSTSEEPNLAFNTHCN